MKAGDKLVWWAEGKRPKAVSFVGVLSEGSVCVELAPGRTRSVPLHELYGALAAAPLVRAE